PAGTPRISWRTSSKVQSSSGEIAPLENKRSASSLRAGSGGVPVPLASRPFSSTSKPNRCAYHPVGIVPVLTAIAVLLAPASKNPLRRYMGAPPERRLACAHVHALARMLVTKAGKTGKKDVGWFEYNACRRHTCCPLSPERKIRHFR